MPEPAQDGSQGQPGGPQPAAERPSPLAERPSPAAERPSLWRGKLLFWLPWPLLVVADLWSKHEVFSWMLQRFGHDDGNYLVFHSDLLTFRLVTWGNRGTIWGLFQDSTIPLMVLRCAAVVALLWFVRATAQKDRLQLFVLSLIFAGALGNLYDNFFRADRSVRDFLRFEGSWPVAWEFPAFNVADSCITVGAIGLLLLLMRSERQPEQRAQKAS